MDFSVNDSFGWGFGLLWAEFEPICALSFGQFSASGIKKHNIKEVFFSLLNAGS